MFLKILGYSDLDSAKKIIEICDLPVSPKEYVKQVRHYSYLLRDVKLLPGIYHIFANYLCNDLDMEGILGLPLKKVSFIL